MKTTLVAILVMVGLVSGGAAYAGDGGVCVRSHGVMAAYARPDEPKQAPGQQAPGTGKPMRVAVKVQPKPHTQTLRQPTGMTQPAQDDPDGPLRIGSRVQGKPDTST